MKLKIIFIFLHTLLVVSSTSKVKEDSDYRNSEKSVRKQKSHNYSTNYEIGVQTVWGILFPIVFNFMPHENENYVFEFIENFRFETHSFRTDLPNENSHFASKNLSKLKNTVVSLPKGSIDQIAEQVAQNSNRYKELAEAFQEQQQLLRTILDSIAIFHGEFSSVGKRLTQLENMCPNATVTVTTDSTPQSASTIRCGGKLLGESGVISYKEYERYNEGESCTWIIEVPEASKIGFKLEKSGLELCCDHVNVTSLDTAGLVQQSSVKLKSYHTVIAVGPKAMVRFTSDESRTGLGFRLSYYNITDLNSTLEGTIEESECGGVIVRETGVISYKFEEPYFDGERCVWLVHSPNSTSITFNLRQAGLETCCDFVSVTSIDPEAGTLRNDTRLLKEHDESVTIQESMVAIVFSSDVSVRGTGFFLTFSGSGVNTNPEFVYKLRHIAEHNATIEYSASDRKDNEITKQQHIYVTAISAKGDSESSRGYISGIDLNAGIFLRANDSSCLYDSLTFFEPLVRKIDAYTVHVWQKKAQIPSENDTLLCLEKVSVTKQKRFLEFRVDSFLAIYKPINNDTLESNAAVSFDYYYKPYECAEIMQPLDEEFGIISYKENENYRNLENCSWIIEVTNATRIDFNLEQSGFEKCCDYVLVTSFDMAGQTHGPTLRLRAGSPTASVTGSRALVNFISDRSVVGSGFRLRYQAGLSLDENVCGGVLNPVLDNLGVINYKANENYANHENCQWRIETPEWGRIGFTLEQSGFEDCCDYLTISSVTANGIEIGELVQLKYDNLNSSVTGPTALVRFTSDGSGTGTGFRLRYEKLPVLGQNVEHI